MLTNVSIAVIEDARPRNIPTEEGNGSSIRNMKKFAIMNAEPAITFNTFDREMNNTTSEMI